MDGAFRASRLFFAKAAMTQAQTDVLHQIPAIWTQAAAMLVTAINLDHRGNGFPFPGQPAILKAAGRNRIMGGGVHTFTSFAA